MKALFSVLFILTMATSAFAYDWLTCPFNGHMYKLVEGFPWEQAEANAVALGGHLVTINDYNENQWILENIVKPITNDPVWIGLHQLPGSGEPGDGWVWVSGEPVTYINWSPGEPNQYQGLVEDWAEMYGYDTPQGCWNDVNLTMTRARLGVVEVIPPYEPEWIYNPATGHYYARTGDLSPSVQYTWVEAEAQAVQYGGHLVTINDSAEEQWLTSTFGPTDWLWCGFNDMTTEGTWVWSSGEPVTYTNWNIGEPSDTNNEDFSGFNIASTHGWNDFPDWYRLYGIIEVIPPAPPTYAVSGNLALLNYLGAVTDVPVAAELRKHGGATTTTTINLDSSGGFTINDVAVGDYDIAFKASHWLRDTLADVSVYDNVTGLAVTLTNGDVDGDNDVDTTDLNAFKGKKKLRPEADLNGDGQTDSQDMKIVRGNLGSIGDP